MCCERAILFTYVRNILFTSIQNIIMTSKCLHYSHSVLESFHINYYENSLHNRCSSLSSSLSLSAFFNSIAHHAPSPRHICGDLPFFSYLAVCSPPLDTQKETIPHPGPSHGPQIGHFVYNVDITTLISVQYHNEMFLSRT